MSLVEEVERWDNNRQWGTARFAQPEFEQINCRAYFDYQRERVYARTSTALRKVTRNRKKNRRQKLRGARRVVVTSKLCAQFWEGMYPDRPRAREVRPIAEHPNVARVSAHAAGRGVAIAVTRFPATTRTFCRTTDPT